MSVSKNRMIAAMMLAGIPVAAQSAAPEIRFDSSEPLKLPEHIHLGEVAGVAGERHAERRHQDRQRRMVEVAEARMLRAREVVGLSVAEARPRAGDEAKRRAHRDQGEHGGLRRDARARGGRARCHEVIRCRAIRSRVAPAW